MASIQPPNTIQSNGAMRFSPGMKLKSSSGKARQAKYKSLRKAANSARPASATRVFQLNSKAWSGCSRWRSTASASSPLNGLASTLASRLKVKNSATAASVPNTNQAIHNAHSGQPAQ